jgi:hypothetical protein
MVNLIFALIFLDEASGRKFHINISTHEKIKSNKMNAAGRSAPEKLSAFTELRLKVSACYKCGCVRVSVKGAD